MPLQKGKQLLTFFVLAYLISWTIWLPLYGHVFGLTNLITVPYHHALGSLGPMLASFLTTWFYLRNKGLKRLLKKCLQVKPLVYVLIALFSPFFFTLIAAILNYVISGASINISGLLTTKEFPHFNLAVFFIYNLIFFGFGEEAGWRGFALPRLQHKANALTASVVLSFFWALWHLPLFFYRPGYTHMNVAGLIGWWLSLLTGSILLTWLYNASKGSIFVCAVFHSTIDIAFTADIANENIANYLGFLITAWGLSTIIIFKPKHLSRHERQKINAEPDGVNTSTATIKM